MGGGDAGGGCPKEGVGKQVRKVLPGHRAVIGGDDLGGAVVVEDVDGVGRARRRGQAHPHGLLRAELEQGVQRLPIQFDLPRADR